MQPGNQHLEAELENIALRQSLEAGNGNLAGRRSSEPARGCSARKQCLKAEAGCSMRKQSPESQLAPGGSELLEAASTWRQRLEAELDLREVLRHHWEVHQKYNESFTIVASLKDDVAFLKGNKEQLRKEIGYGLKPEAVRNRATNRIHYTKPGSFIGPSFG